MASQMRQIHHPVATIIFLNPSEEPASYQPDIREAADKGAVVLAGHYITATVAKRRTELYTCSEAFRQCDTFHKELQLIQSLTSTLTPVQSSVLPEQKQLDCTRVTFLGQVLTTLLPEAETQPPPIGYPYLPHGMSLEHIRLAELIATPGEAKEKSDVHSGRPARKSRY